MEGNGKFLVITNVLTIILIVGLGVLLVFTNLKDDKTSDKCVTEKQEEKVESNDILVYSSSYEDYKLYLTDNNVVKLVSTELDNKNIAENIASSYTIYAGMSNLCEGNRWLIMVDNEHKFTALSIDSLVCSNEIKTINVSDELNKKNLTNTSVIYDTKSFTNEFEPRNYQVYALDEDGNSVEITDIFTK